MPVPVLKMVAKPLAELVQVTVLDKSRSDWKEFKGTNEELEEELETYKKSAGTVSWAALCL